MAYRSQIISFRLPPDIISLLDQHRQPTGLSRGDWVRMTVVNHLMGADSAQLENDFQRLHERCDELDRMAQLNRKSIAYSLFILLNRIGGISEADAKEIVRTGLTNQ